MTAPLPLLRVRGLRVEHGARGGLFGRGEVVRAVDLPVPLNGTPMTYMTGGKQYIVAAYGSGAEAGLVALTLP